MKFRMTRAERRAEQRKQRPDGDIAKAEKPGELKSLSTSDPNSASKERASRLYEAHRESLNALAEDAAKRFDTWLITLSAGAFGLTLTFLKDIVSPRPLRYPYVLLAAWLLFALAIACILIGLDQAYTAGKQRVRDLNDVYRTKSYPFWDEVHKIDRSRRRPKLITMLNKVSILCFVAGLICLSSFAFLNLLEKSNVGF